MKFLICDIRNYRIISEFEAVSEEDAKPMAKEFLVNAGFPIEDNAKFILVRQVEGFTLGSNELWSELLRCKGPKTRWPHTPIG